MHLYALVTAEADSLASMCVPCKQHLFTEVILLALCYDLGIVLQLVVHAHACICMGLQWMLSKNARLIKCNLNS